MGDLTKVSKFTARTKPAGLTRRNLLKGTAASVGLVAGTAVLGGFPTIWAQDKDLTVRVLGMVLDNMPALEDSANEALPFTVKQSAVELGVIQQRGLTQPNSSDLFEPAALNMKFMWPSGNFQAWDTTKLPEWDNIVDIYKAPGKIWPDASYGQGQHPHSVIQTSSQYATDFVKPASTKWLVYHPMMHDADTLGVRTEVIGRPIESWAELINPEFSGRAAILSFPAIGAMDAALALEANGEIKYSNKGNMTIEEIDFTLDRLIEMKKAGHFRALWSTFNESVQLMISGEVVIQSMWAAAVTAVRSQGMSVDFPGLKEGYRSWTLGHLLAKHVEGKKLGAAYDYVTWLHSGPAGAFIARFGYYVVSWQNTKKSLPAAEWDYWFEGKPATIDIPSPFGEIVRKAGEVRDGGSYKNRMGRVAVWNSVMDENEYLTDRWNEFIAA